MTGQHDGLEDRLGQRFGTLAVLLAASETIKNNWTNEFLKRYTEPHRYYHTLAHIEAMLACHDRMPVKDEAVSLAIFFHDWIYDPLREDNELESVKIFEQFAKDVEIAVGLRQTVVGLIQATITHNLHNNDECTKLFLDFDLEVLSRPRQAYEIYAKQIRDEYSHFGDDAYQKGRISVLEKFLDRDRIYYSEAFADREEAARDNIRTEVVRLKEKDGTISKDN